MRLKVLFGAVCLLCKVHSVHAVRGDDDAAMTNDALLPGDAAPVDFPPRIIPLPEGVWIKNHRRARSACSPRTVLDSVALLSKVQAIKGSCEQLARQFFRNVFNREGLLGAKAFYELMIGPVF